MNRKSILLTLSISLFFSALVFAQTENQYSRFDPVSLKENAKYVRNFAPNNYDEKILYQCFTEMVDLARAEFRYVPKLKHDVSLDSTAQFQADYQASKDEKTLENNAPYKTTYFRLRKYGLAGNGDELVGKAKAYMGEAEYSYYDLCLSLVQSFLKNLKTADVMLAERYTYMGFGANTDPAMKSIYVSLVLGNDRTFNHYKAGYNEKDLPYTKGQAGLKGYDDRVCKKCASEPGLEILSECVSVNKNGEIYLNSDNYKELKRLIGKDGDAIAIDIVQEGQYECDNHQVDYDLWHRGTVTKPITFEKLMAANENANLKSGRLIAKICDLPASVDDSKGMDIIVLVLKEGNRVCRAVMAKHIESKGADYTEKINFVKDEAGVRSTASIPSAAAERNTAPRLVGFMMSSSTAIRRAFRQISAGSRRGLRRMAHSTPRVRGNPVSSFSTGSSAVNRGISPHRSTTSAAWPRMCFRSIKRLTGSYPASRARWMTLGLSAINSSLSSPWPLRSWFSVSRA